MKILHIPNQGIPPTGAPATAPIPSPTAAGADPERVEALEHVAKSILEKIQSMEERIHVLEQTPKNSSSPMAIDDVKNTSPISVDAEAVKKNLGKMWKYLNDKAAA